MQNYATKNQDSKRIFDHNNKNKKKNTLQEQKQEQEQMQANTSKQAKHKQALAKHLRKPIIVRVNRKNKKRMS